MLSLVFSQIGQVGTEFGTGTVGVVIQIIVQTGALGLLAIIVWHIPKMVKELKEWRQASDDAHKTEREELQKERVALLEAYRSEARYEREACQHHFDKLAEMGQQNQSTTHHALDRLGQAVDKVGQAVSSHDNLAREAIKQLTKDPNDNTQA